MSCTGREQAAEKPFRQSRTSMACTSGTRRASPPQDSRARLAGRASRTGVRSPKFEVYGTSNLIVTHWLMPDTMLPPISPVPPFPLVAHRSRLALHAPRSVALADYFSILL